MDQDSSPGPRDIRPVPDPTLLTTQQLVREINALKELLFQRIDAVEKAMEVFRKDITSVPTEVDRAVARLKELHETRFASVDQRFISAEKLSDQERRASEAAIAKTERAVEQSLKEIGLRGETTERALSGRIDDNKTAIVRIDTSISAQANARSTAQSAQGHLIAIGTFVLAASVLLASVVMSWPRAPTERVLVGDPKEMRVPLE